MDSILLENQSTAQFEQQSLSFQPNDSFFPHNNEDGYTTLNDIRFDIEDLDDDDGQGLEQGEIDRSKLSFYKPLYKEMAPTINDLFYKNFYNEAEVIPGPVPIKYSILGNRLSKFFTQREDLQRGERINKRIEADYSNPSTHPLCFAVMLYGVDFLSNKDIRKIFKLPKESKCIKRINWSNATVFFESKVQLEEVLKPLIWDKQKHSFFDPKEEQDLSEEMSVPKKLPRSWYGLRPYEHKQELIFWFVRYLTSTEPDHLGQMKDTIEFMEQYNAAKKLWLKKTKEQEDFRNSSLNSSRYETIDRSRKDRSLCLGSEPEKRQRSREKSRGAASENFARSGVLSELESNDNHQKMLTKHPDLNESYVEPMSFVYAPTNDMRVDAELKKRSDQIIMMMEEMHVGGADTLESLKSGSMFDMDDDMAIISDNFDPRGLDERFFFDRKNKIAELTTLKPDEKFNYREYTEKILEAEEEIKQKKVIPVICID